MLRVYYEQLKAGPDEVDLGFWRRPVGVEVPGDPLRFLYVPDNAEQAMIWALTGEIRGHQERYRGTGHQITKAVMVTMGGLLPGVLSYDHLAWMGGDLPKIEFGTVGVELYKGPGQRLKRPKVVQDLTISVKEETVLEIDDLGDFGWTSEFVEQILLKKGAQEVWHFLPYLKPAAEELFGGGDRVFSFGEVPQGTWVITPRERVETLVKRVKVWRDDCGASEDQCRINLQQIGYPEYLINSNLPLAYEG